MKINKKSLLLLCYSILLSLFAISSNISAGINDHIRGRVHKTSPQRNTGRIVNQNALSFNTKGYTTREDIDRVWFSNFNCYPKWKFVKKLPKTNEVVRYVYRCYIDKGTYNIKVTTIGCKKGALVNTPVYIMIIDAVLPSIEEGLEEMTNATTDLEMLYLGYRTPQGLQVVKGLSKAEKEAWTIFRNWLSGGKVASTSPTGFEVIIIPPYRVGIVYGIGPKLKPVGASCRLMYDICPMTMVSILDKLGSAASGGLEELKRRGF